MSEDSLFRSGRLPFYKTSPCAKYWDTIWKNYDLKKQSTKGNISFLKSHLLSYLPVDKAIIDAGCGIGQYVYTLINFGMDIVGIDYAPKTVSTINSSYPDLPVFLQDATQTTYADGSFSGYISFGVMEHDPTGPNAFLKEANRILSPDGVLMVSVPHFNFLRKLKFLLKGFKGKKSDPFHLYYYTRKALHRILYSHGFEVVDTLCFNPALSLRRELPIFKGVLKNKFVKNWLNNSPHLSKLASHSILLICKKSSFLSQFANRPVFQKYLSHRSFFGQIFHITGEDNFSSEISRINFFAEKEDKFYDGIVVNTDKVSTIPKMNFRKLILYGRDRKKIQRIAAQNSLRAKSTYHSRINQLHFMEIIT